MGSGKDVEDYHENNSDESFEQQVYLTPRSVYKINATDGRQISPRIG